jgi:glycosyltransferase involved in cell wall biosynthesis
MRIAYVTPVHADPAHHALLDALARLGCEATSVPADEGRELGARLVELGPELVHIDDDAWSPAAVRAAAVAERIGAVSVVTLRRDARGLGLRERWRRRRVLAAASAAVSADAPGAEALASLKPGLSVEVVPQLPVIPPSQPPERPAPAGLRLGFVGRLEEGCGLELLLRAVAKVHGTWSVDVLTTGPAQVELEGVAERLGMGSRVRWHGALPRQALAQRWETIDLVALPRRADVPERLAHLLAEAMAHGVAALVGQAPRLRAVVGDGAPTIAADDPPLLAEMLQRLLDLPEERIRLAEAGRRRAIECYAPEAVAATLSGLWRRAAEARHVAKP